jgi:hypothetical protein
VLPVERHSQEDAGCLHGRPRVDPVGQLASLSKRRRFDAIRRLGGRAVIVPLRMPWLARLSKQTRTMEMACYLGMVPASNRFTEVYRSNKPVNQVS